MLSLSKRATLRSDSKGSKTFLRDATEFGDALVDECLVDEARRLKVSQSTLPLSVMVVKVVSVEYELPIKMGHLTFCHPYKWHSFVCHFYTGTYTFVIVNSNTPNF